jgi:hypothetical protein
MTLRAVRRSPAGLWLVYRGPDVVAVAAVRRGAVAVAHRPLPGRAPVSMADVLAALGVPRRASRAAGFVNLDVRRAA